MQGVVFLIHRGQVTEDGRSVASFNSIVDQQKNRDAHQNATADPPFLLSPDMLCCNKLDCNGVPTHSLKVYILAEIQGG